MKAFGIIVLVILALVLLWFIGKGCQVAEKVTNVDTAFINYEQFQEMWNTCQKINTDLGIIKDVPEDDKQFEQFGKQQQIIALKKNLNRWVEEYNAKSKMWHKSVWKSEKLPYQLTVEQFSNY